MKIKRIVVLIIMSVFALALFSCTHYPTFDRIIVPIDLEEYRSRYPDIRFGEDGNSLLLDVEWHTYETYLDEYIPKLKKKYEDYRQSDDYIYASELYKSNYDAMAEDHIARVEKNAELVKENKLFVPRLVNGAENQYLNSRMGDISEYIDSDGYFVWDNIYPYMIYISYFDEDYIFHVPYNVIVYTIEEYQYRLKTEVIPLCDELLDKCYIDQEKYDLLTMDDPVAIYIAKFWGLTAEP